jgi:lipoprotein NlpI
MAFRNRGIAAFCDRRFPHAKKDCAEAVRLDPKDGHNLIWLYLASARDGKADKAQLEGQVTGLDLRKWPGPAVEFLLGSLTLEALLATSHHENLYKEREQRCAAHFFIGQRELLNGRLLEAANSFREVIASGAMNCLEYQAAEAELQDMNAE